MRMWEWWCCLDEGEQSNFLQVQTITVTEHDILQVLPNIKYFSNLKTINGCNVGDEGAELCGEAVSGICPNSFQTLDLSGVNMVVVVWDR